MCSVTQLCPTLCDPMNCSLQGASVHGIFQARILELVALSYSRVSSLSRDWTHISCIPCIHRRTPNHCATWEALKLNDCTLATIIHFRTFSSLSKETLHLLAITHQAPHLWQPLICSLPLSGCWSWTFHVNGTMPCAVLCAWLLSLSTVFPCFIHVAQVAGLHFFLWPNNFPLYGCT